MTFNDLLDAKGIVKKEVLVLRHTPKEQPLNEFCREFETAHSISDNSISASDIPLALESRSPARDALPADRCLP